MSFLEHKWSEHNHQVNPLRRYSSQREFEADWIGQLRRRYSLSQEALANMANVSVTTVQNWENPRSHKNIAGHNQERLRDIERGMWIKAHVTVLDPCPPYIRALHDLLAANRDESAQGLAEYLIQSLQPDDPERARLLHWAGLTYSIADPCSPKALHYEEAALETLTQSDARLSAAIENEILGCQFEDLMSLPAGRERQAKGRRIMAACERLFDRDQQPAYKWNALEVACRAPLDVAEQFRLVSELIALLGEARVRRRIMTEDAFGPARVVFEQPAVVN
jgi:transcriptional regulator with XRE-family HTH domain